MNENETAVRCDTPVPGPAAGRPKGALIALAIAYCLIGLAAVPLGEAAVKVAEWLGFVWAGIPLSILVLLAVWAALGPPPAMQRIMWTSAALVSAVYALFVGLRLDRGAGPPPGDEVMIFIALLALFVLYTLLLAIVRRLSTWQITHDSDPIDPHPAELNQFRIQDLMIAAAIVATALGLGRCLIPFETLAQGARPNIVHDLLAGIGIYALVLLPIAAIVGICLALRSGQPRRTWALSAFWAVVNFLAVLLLVRNVRHAGALSDVVTPCACFQLGGLIASYVSVVAINAAGYRLVRRKRRQRPSSAAGSANTT
jgi:hypothetical protein